MLRRLIFGIAALFAIFVLYIVLAGSVSKNLSAEDVQAIKSLRASQHCSDRGSFDKQLGCIVFVQRSVQTRVPDMRCEEGGDPIEPMNFLRRGYGCCFDRARFMSKALEYFGYETRHVSLHDRSRFGVFSYLAPGIQSHATTEVLTNRGWMAVDSNFPFVLLTRSMQPVSYSQYKNFKGELRQQPKPAEFFNSSLLVTYGLYSRHGRFHGFNLPAPEINYPEFIKYNFLGD